MSKLEDKDDPGYTPLTVGHSDFEPYPHDTHKLPQPKLTNPIIPNEEIQKMLAQQAKAKEVAALKRHEDNQKAMVEKPKEAMRFSDDKLRFDLIPPEALIELARVYSMGALKYEDENWRKGLPYSSSVRAINSHLILWRSGQTVDEETGCHHLAQVAWNALTLLVYDLTKSGKDDRIKFSVDAEFNWVDNHLKLGKTKEEKKALREKYKKQRENAK